jgi:radical SAM protein with 4Fe4S-binding SPASM domain
LYYRLNNHCILVEGALRGAIYDFASGKVHSINQGAVQLLKACQQHNLDDLLERNRANKRVNRDFLDRLTETGLGSVFYSRPVSKPAPTAPEAVTLDFLWLELTAKCNNRCLHCYADCEPEAISNQVTHERWLSVISEAREAGATAIQLIGGEPLLYPLWQELVAKAHAEGYSYIEIFTNGTLIDPAAIDFFKQYNVNIATTIYADNALIHDAVTTNPGSFAKTMSAIDELLAAKVPLRIASIIMKINENEVENIRRLYAKLGVDIVWPDVVRPTGRGNDEKLLPTAYGQPAVRSPFYTDERSFSMAQRYHSCLAGKIAITATGDVIPCIFARNEVCGNILATSLREVLDGQQLQQCWQTTKDKIKKCQNCEYRYACADCRPLAQGKDPDKCWLVCPAGCSYNPYTGKWEDATNSKGGDIDE